MRYINQRSLPFLITLPLYVEVKMETDSFDEKDSGDKSAAFTVLLHGSLKVEQMVALVQIGFVCISAKLLLNNNSRNYKLS